MSTCRHVWVASSPGVVECRWCHQPLSRAWDVTLQVHGMNAPALPPPRPPRPSPAKRGVWARSAEEDARVEEASIVSVRRWADLDAAHPLSDRCDTCGCRVEARPEDLEQGVAAEIVLPVAGLPLYGRPPSWVCVECADADDECPPTPRSGRPPFTYMGPPT